MRRGGKDNNQEPEISLNLDHRRLPGTIKNTVNQLSLEDVRKYLRDEKLYVFTTHLFNQIRAKQESNHSF